MDRRAMKYITVKNEEGTVYPVIFPPTLTHKDVARAVQGLFHREGFRTEPESAGFVDEIECRCYGKSESMGIGSKPEQDQTVITGDWSLVV